MRSDQERVAGTLAGHGPVAPSSLRASVEAEAARAERLRPRPGAVRMRVALGVAVAAVTAALAVVIPNSGGGAPSPVDIHELAGRGAVADAPPPRAGRPQLLARRVEGVSFPNWTRKFGWRASGQRSDSLGGRRTTTVYYRHTEHDIAYTIVAGRPLAPPEGARRVRVNGVDLYRFRHGDHEVAVFERGGHTCVITGHVKHRDTVVKLATWKGDGRVRF